MLADEEIRQFIEAQIPQNTKAKTKCDLGIFKRWLTTALPEEKREIEEIPADELNGFLRSFYLTAKKLNGDEYEPDGLTSIKNSLDRYLAEKGYGQSLSRSEEFKTSMDALNAKGRQLKAAGRGRKPNRAEPVSESEEQTLWKEGIFGSHSPQALQRAIWWRNNFFGFRGRDEHHKLKWGDLKIGATRTILMFISRVFLKLCVSTALAYIVEGGDFREPLTPSATASYLVAEQLLCTLPVKGGRDEHHKLKWGDLKIGEDVGGVRHITFRERDTKTRKDPRDERAFNPRIFETPEDPQTCPVNLLLEFTHRRPLSMCTDDSPFYLQVHPKWDKDPGNLWFKCQPLGVHSLGGMMKSIAEVGNLPGRKTNHSGRKTTVWEILSFQEPRSLEGSLTSA